MAPRKVGRTPCQGGPVPGATHDPAHDAASGEVLSQLAAMRERYAHGRLLESDLAPGAQAPTPLAQFARWIAEATVSGLPEPNAMVLASVDTSGPQPVPSTRSVLLKHVDADGFVFFTNYGSRKARELDADPWASLLFPWYAVRRQISVVGRVEKVDRAESAEYFGARPYTSRIGAWASPQSAVVASREVLTARFAELAAAFPDNGGGDDVPLPDFWGGYRLAPGSVEFWQGRESRLHDRLRFTAYDGPGAALDDPHAWTVERLAP